MKNKSLIAWIVIGVLALIVAFTIFISTLSKSSINWDEHYTGDSKDPYGEYLLQELLTDKYSLNNSIIKQPLFRSLPTSEDSLNRNYLFIGGQLYLNKQDEQALLTFIENGNTAFIAANDLPYPIRYLLKTGNAYTYDSLHAFADEPIQESLIDTTEAVAFDTIPVHADESYTTDTLPTVPTIVINLVKKSTPVDSTSMQYTSVISTAITVTFKPPVPEIKAAYSFSSPKNNPCKWKGIQK
ncbi:MAG: hypothetical protein H7259_08935, partial [Cytophagales bacterium]|nr:hypothetical protein [Cytophaga sp.]